MAVDGTGMAGDCNPAPDDGKAWKKMEQEYGTYFSVQAMCKGFSGGGQRSCSPRLPGLGIQGGLREAGAAEFPAENIPGQCGEHGGGLCTGRTVVPGGNRQAAKAAGGCKAR